MEQIHSNGSSQPNPEVIVGWQSTGERSCPQVRDNGPGFSTLLMHLFPSTPPSPRGADWPVLSREIVEAHGGTIELSNREYQRGCKVRLSCPEQSRSCYVQV